MNNIIRQHLLNSISKKLSTERKSLKVSQKVFAGTIGVSERTYKRMELGETLPTIDVAVEVCSILKINLNELCNYETN
jgi:DNA-binding XRE family transcriptional regulator